ncbi:hypothetical protein ACWEN3_20135 [Streptomyces sp. NPDC004561]
MGTVNASPLLVVERLDHAGSTTLFTYCAESVPATPAFTFCAGPGPGAAPSADVAFTFCALPPVAAAAGEPAGGPWI